MIHEAATTILGREKKLAIHFPEIPFLSSETRHVKAPVHDSFLGRHLVIEQTAPAAEPFLLYDIRVGHNSQIAATGWMDSRAFAPLPKEIMSRLVEREDAEEIVKILYNLGRTADWALRGVDLTLVAGRDDDHHNEPIPFRARIYGDTLNDASERPRHTILPDEARRSRNPPQTILPFHQEFKRGETIRVKNRPQIFVTGRRLVYGGLPGEFVLRDILVGADSYWKSKGRKPTPMEEFAPVPPKAREAISAKASPTDIAAAVENALSGTAAPSVEVTLLVECIGKGGLFMSHLIGDMSE